MLGWYMLAWFPMIPIAIANGTLRETTYGKRMPELRAHQISTVTGIILFGIYVGLLSHFWPLRSKTEALTVGALWGLATVLFEFGFGHYLAGHSWQRLLHDYNLLKGRVWVLILIWVAVAPYVFHVLHGRP